MSTPWTPPTARQGRAASPPGRIWFMIAGTALAVASGFYAVLLWFIVLHVTPRGAWGEAVLEILGVVWPACVLSALCFGAAAHPRIWMTWLTTLAMASASWYIWQRGGGLLFAVCGAFLVLCLAGAVSVTLAAWRSRSNQTGGNAAGRGRE